MKIVFMGSSDFSIPSLKELISAGHEILALVCQPDKPNGRGNKIEFSNIKKFALEKNIKVLQYQKIRFEGVEELKALNPDLIVVVSYGQILSDEIINIGKYGCINVHASLLPKYRGASPIVSAIMNGEEKTGVTIMRVAREVDAGNMLAREETQIFKNETGGELSNRLAEIGAKLLVKVVEQIETGNFSEEVQNADEATFTKMIKKEDLELDFSMSATEIYNKVRALCPAPVAYMLKGNDKIKIYETEIVECNENIPSGEIISADRINGIVIKCGKDAIKILKLQAPGGKVLDYKNYLNGKKF
ncbi:MAG: methionyl-tRNA formyltransferase [Christensenellales bacterium]